MTVLIVLAYLVVLIATITTLVFTNQFGTRLFGADYGIPISIVIWGAIGSLAAILYRFYTETERVRFGTEARWLIARPIIGIVMGMIAYLAFVSGLTLVTRGQLPNEAQSSPEFYWLVAFLAGFSDKFYIQIINLFVDHNTDSNDERNFQVSKKEIKRDEEEVSNAIQLQDS
jgi:hypothetical protein